MKHFKIVKMARNRGAAHLHGLLYLAIFLVMTMIFGLGFMGCSSKAESAGPPESQSNFSTKADASTGSTTGSGFAMNGSTSGMVPYPPKEPAKPLQKDSPDEFENFARRIEIVNAVVTNGSGREQTGAWLTARWRNNAGREIREVRASVTLTDESGNARPIAPIQVWLYASHTPVDKGVTVEVRVPLGTKAQPAGTKAQVLVTLATKGVSAH